MAIEIVSFPIKNGGSFHSYVNVDQAGSYQKKNQIAAIHIPGDGPKMWR